MQSKVHIGLFTYQLAYPNRKRRLIMSFFALLLRAAYKTIDAKKAFAPPEKILKVKQNLHHGIFIPSNHIALLNMQCSFSYKPTPSVSQTINTALIAFVNADKPQRNQVITEFIRIKLSRSLNIITSILQENNIMISYRE